jgi:hypothetical protein
MALTDDAANGSDIIINPGMGSFGPSSFFDLLSGTPDQVMVTHDQENKTSK